MAKAFKFPLLRWGRGDLIRFFPLSVTNSFCLRPLRYRQLSQTHLIKKPIYMYKACKLENALRENKCFDVLNSDEKLCIYRMRNLPRSDKYCQLTQFRSTKPKHDHHQNKNNLVCYVHHPTFTACSLILKSILHLF